MDCDLARRLLPLGSADLDVTDRSALDQHLAGCPDCSGALAADHAFDAGLSQGMGAVPIPDAFRVRLTTRLLAARMAFYRRLAIRGLAALLAVGLAWGGLAALRRPTLDPTAVASQVYDLAGQGKTDAEARDGVTGWLKPIDGKLEAPDEFNYRLFAFACRSEFQGVTGVPTLVFVHNDATMRVYAVRENSFKDLAAFREAVEVGGCTVEARRYDTMPGWVFIVMTSGAPPDEFRRPNRPAQPA
jgi:hypothetical protein